MLGKYWQDFGTSELRALGEVVTELTVGAAMAAAEDAQEDGRDSAERGVDNAEIVAAREYSPITQPNAIPVLDYYEDPIDIGRDLLRELDALGYEVVRR